MARQPAPGTRQRILDVASRLFQEQGVRAVGLQQVIDDTGVGKSLLYREFAGKDDLIAAWLREGRASWWAAVEAAERPHAGDPARQLLAFIEMAYDAVAAPDFRGCMFHNTSNEFRHAEHPGRQEAAEHLADVRAHFVSLARAAKADDPKALADELAVIFDGMFASGAVLGARGPARAAVALADTVIRRRCPAA